MWPREHREPREWRESNPDGSSSGSIIKDLLLKSRVPFPPPATADTSESFPCPTCRASFTTQELLHLYPNCSGGIAASAAPSQACPTNTTSTASAVSEWPEDHIEERHVSVRSCIFVFIFSEFLHLSELKCAFLLDFLHKFSDA